MSVEGVAIAWLLDRLSQHIRHASPALFAQMGISTNIALLVRTRVIRIITVVQGDVFVLKSGRLVEGIVLGVVALLCGAVRGDHDIQVDLDS